MDKIYMTNCSLLIKKTETQIMKIQYKN